jgi:catechol 2,3-dioxygenase-like lactoylglutathione lyase family enzyme
MASAPIFNGFRLNHVGLRVASIEKSVAFYTQVFGMEELARIPLDTVTIAFLGYNTPETAKIPLWAREGVLELVAPKVSSLPTYPHAEGVVCLLKGSESRHSITNTARCRLAFHQACDQCT